ncbi:hypothetical protein ACWV26_11110 [Rummeliibacillus sp. JY-2-4R]
MALKRTIRIFTMIVILTVAAFPFYIHFEKKQKYADTLDYLMVEKEYYDSDMQSIKVFHSIPGILSKSQDEWTIQVVFNDEPNAKYFYQVNDGKVIQTSWSGSTENDIYMHSESVECGPFGN